MKDGGMRMTKAQAAAPAPAVEQDALAEMNRLLFEAPIAELAESQGISIDCLLYTSPSPRDS